MPRLRGWVTTGVIACLVIAVGGVVATVFWGWGYLIPISSRTDLDTTVIGLASLGLVVVGAVLALFAYRAATGRPDLDCEIKFRFSKVNEPVFEVDQSPSDDCFTLKQAGQTQATVRLVNRSRFSAQNPGVRLVVKDLYGLTSQFGWSIVEWDSAGVSEFQWDGTIVHGNWSRALPDLHFNNVTGPTYSLDGHPEIEVTLAADGVEPKRLRVPIKLLMSKDYREHLPPQGKSAQGKPVDE